MRAIVNATTEILGVGSVLGGVQCCPQDETALALVQLEMRVAIVLCVAKLL